MRSSRIVAALIAAAIAVLIVLGACSVNGAAGEVSEKEADRLAEAAEVTETASSEKTGKKVYFAVFFARVNYQKLQNFLENLASPIWRKLQRIRRGCNDPAARSLQTYCLATF